MADIVVYEVYNSVEEAMDAGTMWGVDFLPLDNVAIGLLKSGKVLKCSNNCEYVQIIAMRQDEIMGEVAIIDG